MKNLKDVKLPKEELPIWMEVLGNLHGFSLPLKNGKKGLIIVSKDGDWEHVSMQVIKGNKEMSPTYEEMCELKYSFFSEEEITIQVHPAKSEYVNCHPYVLHLWRNKSITPKAESRLKRRIFDVYSEAKQCLLETGKEIFLSEPRVLVIFCGKDWLSWEEICKLKQKYWHPEEAAVQFNVSSEMDCNREHMILLWDASDFELPPKELV